MTMKDIIPISCCPWCKKLPTFKMYRSLSTWVPKLECQNSECTVRPVSQYVPIRKKQKYNWVQIRSKIYNMIDLWNHNHPYKPTHGFEFDFEEIANEERERDGFR
jgi:hypothetical protein